MLLPHWMFNIIYRCRRPERAKGRGVSNQGVRDMDFGLGIGYNLESNAASDHVSSRSAAVNSSRTGMMAQLKSNFVAALSNSQNQVLNQNPGMHATRWMALLAFVSGGTNVETFILLYMMFVVDKLGFLKCTLKFF